MLGEKIVPTTGEIFVVGGCVTISRSCDPDQLWFDFMRGAVFVYSPIQHLTKAPVRTNGKIQVSQNMYHYEAGIEQCALPFVEHLEINRKQLRILHRERFPGWDKDSDGGPIMLGISPRQSAGAIREWCRVNCERHFHVSHSSALFACAKEATIAKMMLGLQ
jgi:hypothetical protein